MSTSLDADPGYASATELRRQLDLGDLSAVELLRTTFDRLDIVNPLINAVVVQRREAALRDAEAADSVPVGERGPLHGMPLTVKDLNETADLPTSLGSRAFEGTDFGFEAVVVGRLKAAGGILIGKTNTPEFGLRPTTENRLFGATVNPWSLDHSPGGSTGGGAAALAAGVVPLAQGNDGGGSCRIPASCCGVVGMKPTRGRVPWAPVAYEYWAGLATNGPLARTVEDAALLLDAMAGAVVGEPYGIAPPSVPFREACRDRSRGRRLAWSATPAHGAVEPAVRGAFLAALGAFSDMGHELEEADPDLGGLFDPFVLIVSGNTAALGELVPPGRLHELEPSTLMLMLEGRRRTAGEYCTAVNVARTEAARIMAFWERYDFLLTPTLTLLPPRSGAMPRRMELDTAWREYLDWLAFTYPFNITGQPAISVPCGWSAEGLPIGLQIIGRYGDDAGVLALAAAFEEARPWRDRYRALRDPAAWRRATTTQEG